MNWILALHKQRKKYTVKTVKWETFSVIYQNLSLNICVGVQAKMYCLKAISDAHDMFANLEINAKIRIFR